MAESGSIRCPYKIFYRISNETVEILYIYHAAREEAQ